MDIENHDDQLWWYADADAGIKSNTDTSSIADTDTSCKSDADAGSNADADAGWWYLHANDDG